MNNTNKIPEIPKIEITTIQRMENGLSEIKQVILPDNKIEQTNLLNHVEDGTYYSIYELCEIVDKHIMKEYITAYDQKTGKKYNLTEEIQHLLEVIPQNLYITRKDFPTQYGQYIHEKALEAIFKRLEKRYQVDKIIKDLIFGKKINRTKQQERDERARKISRAQEQYLEEETKPITFSKVKPKEDKNDIAKTAAALLIVAAVTIAILIPKTSGNAPIYPEPPTTETVYIEPDNNYVTNQELCENIKLGGTYKINTTKLYEASDHSGKYGTISENYYKIAIVAIVDKNDIIHTINMKDYENKEVSEIISKEEIEHAKYKSAAIATSDGTILGWIDIKTENFKELADYLTAQKNQSIKVEYSESKEISESEFLTTNNRQVRNRR